MFSWFFGEQKVQIEKNTHKKHTFGQYNACLLNKIINFFKIIKLEWAIWPNSYIMIWVILFHSKGIYHNIVIFALNKVFMITKLDFLIDTIEIS